MMTKKLNIIIAVTIVVIVLVGILAYYQYYLSKPPAMIGTTTPTATSVKYNIVIATGGVGGVYFYYGQVVASIISNYTDLSATSIQTAASVDNLLLIRDKTDISRGVIYCATVLPDSAYLAYTGQDERFKNATAPISILWVMYPNHLHIVTTVKSGIKTIYDLKGKRVSTGAPGSGTELTTLMLLKLIGIDPSKDFSKWERLGAEESASALLDGRIDAYFWSGGLPTSSIVDLANSLRNRGDNIYLVPLSDDVINVYMSKFPGIAVPGVIKKEVYGAPEDAKTLAFWNMFVCHKDTPVDVAYKITKAVFEHLDILHKSVKAARDTTLQNALLYINGTIPYHEGALKYYREVGVLK
ncbi:MAG: TAXI family TRAP transporter solute-binding subunit [Sulfolobales archaeon]